MEPTSDRARWPSFCYVLDEELYANDAVSFRESARRTRIFAVHAGTGRRAWTSICKRRDRRWRSGSVHAEEIRLLERSTGHGRKNAGIFEGCKPQLRSSAAWA